MGRQRHRQMNGHHRETATEPGLQAIWQPFTQRLRHLPTTITAQLMNTFI
jgi:hypothetical protein